MRNFARKLTAIFVAGVIMLTGTVAFAASPGLSNFQKVNAYQEGMFDDVQSGDWYRDDVKFAYEIGIMKGASFSSFNANGDVTLAEAITMASRLHSIYHTGEEHFQQGDPWYQCYVDYAKKNGIISEDYKNYNEPATRVDFAHILAHSFPSDGLEKINEIEENSIQNIAPKAPYHDSIYQLYEAGILTGSSDPSDFRGWANIVRSEASAIVSRMADESMRKHFTLNRTIPHYADDPLVPDFGKICNTLISSDIPGEDSHDYIYKMEWLDECYLSDWREVLEKEGFQLTGTETSDGGIANVYKNGNITLKEGVIYDEYYAIQVLYAGQETVEPEDPSGPSLSTAADMEGYLLENLDYISTPMGGISVFTKIKVNKQSDTLYDWWIQSEPSSSGIFYDLEYSIDYTAEQKKETIEALRAYQKGVYDAVSKYFPGKKLAGGFYSGFYKYPNLQVGYHSIRAFSWMNYTPSKHTSADDDAYYTSKITDFHWVTTYDIYVFD